MKKNHSKYFSPKVWTSLFLFTAFTGNLNATTYTVPVGGDIQTYVDMAASGDIVQLEAGTYASQSVYISTSGITLQGAGMSESIIQSPPQVDLTTCYTTLALGASQGFCPFILVENATDVTIANLTADGNDQGTGSGKNPVFQGIGYYNAGGTIQNVHATNIAASDPSTDGTQHVYSIAAITDTTPMTPYTVNVTGCTVDNFQKNGIGAVGNTLNDSSFDSLVVNFTNSTVTSAYPAAAPNGIELLYGVSGTISGNTVSDISSPATSGAVSAGILALNCGPLTIANNTVHDNDFGVYAYQTTGPLAITGNNIYNNNTNIASGGGIGLYAGDTTGTTTIENNILSNNVTANLQIQEDSSTPSNQPYQLQNNQFSDGALGLQVYGQNTTGPVITFNGDSFTGTSEYYVQEETSPNGAPNDIWPYLGPVSYDGLIPGQITYEEYEQVRTKIYDKLSPVYNPALGLVVDFVEDAPLPPTSFTGIVKKNKFLTKLEYTLEGWWTAPAPGYAVLYRIYKNGALYAEVPASASLFFETCLNLPTGANGFTISSVNALDIESTQVPITIEGVE